jgi:hypothetical protein
MITFQLFYVGVDNIKVVLNNRQHLDTPHAIKTRPKSCPVQQHAAPAQVDSDKAYPKG